MGVLVSHVSNNAAGIFLFYQNSVLLSKRIKTHKGKSVPFGGYWSLFAGSCKDSENPINCAIRELEEEAGISLSFTDAEYVSTIQRDDLQLHVYAYDCPEMPSIKLNFEHTEYGWFFLDELKNFPYKIDNELVECILFYRRKKLNETKHIKKDIT